MHVRHSFAIGWWPDGKNGTTWTFKRFLNSLAHLPSQNHTFSASLRKKPSWVSLFHSCSWERMLLVPHNHSFLPQWFGLKTLQSWDHVCLCGMYNRVLTLSENLRSTVKLIIYLGRRCLLFRMACTVLADDRTHTAQKAGAASHIEPCPAQHPKVSKPCITSAHTFKLCCWVTLWVNSSTSGITDLDKQTKVQKEIMAWAKGRMSIRGKRKKAE